MRRHTILGLLTLALGVSSCAYYDGLGYGPRGLGGYAYAGDDFTGGGEMLDPWLANTPEGLTIVTQGFAHESGGRISAEAAGRANVWFRRYADTNHDLRLTDEEIRIALVQGAKGRPY